MHNHKKPQASRERAAKLHNNIKTDIEISP